MIYTFVIGLLLAGAGDASRWCHEPYAVASPLDVAVSTRDGTIYVAHPAEGKVVALDERFQPTGWEFEADGVTGIDVSPDGCLAIITGGSKGELITVGDNGVEMRLGGSEVALFADPWGVTWGPDGNLFVFDAGASEVKVFSPDGELLFAFSEYTWNRSYRSRTQKRQVEESVADTLHRPCRGDFLPDGRLIVVDYDGPILDPELQRRGGRYSVWTVNVAQQSATFQRFLDPQPFPDFKAGDVCVDDRTGRIYTAEADFPLTDHDFIRVRDHVDEEPRFGTNFFPYRFITHPRGVAVAANGDVIVAEADKGLVFAIPKSLFDTAKGEPNPLEWPKKIRMPICERDRVVLEYLTLEPALSKVQYAPVQGDWYDYPDSPAMVGRHEVEVPAFTLSGVEKQPGERELLHRVELTNLEPGQRYAFRFLVSEKAWPGPFWSETFLATTKPPKGKTQYLEAEVIVLVFSNLVHPTKVVNVEPDPPDPGPMSEGELTALKERMEWARRFYWINSRGRFNLRFTYVIDDERYDPAPVANWGYWPYDDHRTIDEILARHGVEHADTAGLCVIYGYRNWNERQQRWVLTGSGGNTWGSCHDGSAVNTINAGGDTCWLFVHEYGHSMGINYQYSGQLYHYNHFHWNFLPTDYGAHYDGMAAMCREFKDIAYWANKYGRLRVVADADGDGLVDDDPRVPLDEKRFWSDPKKVDSDDDGLDDLEEMLATMGLGRYEQAFGMRQVEPIFEPDPRNVDTDGDGTRDGDDRYPLYPWDPAVHEASITVDGEIASTEWPWRGFRRQMLDEDLTGDVRLAWDREHLYIGLLQKMRLGDTRPAKMYIEIDANNDGMTVGADNIEMWLEPQEDGSVNVRTRYNDTIIRLKPRWFDNILPNPRDVKARWTEKGTEYHLEIAIPQTRDAGLELSRFEEIGLLFQLEPQQASQELRLFEPQQHFDIQLR